MHVTRSVVIALSAVGVGILSTSAVSAQAPDSAAFAAAVTYATQTDGQAVLVMHQGKRVFEHYMRGGSITTRQMLASGSKSFVGVATIAAVADGWMQLDAPVSRYLQEWKSDPRKSRITVRQLLSLESGLETGNLGTGCGGRGATWPDAIAAKPLHEPGTQFAYGPYPFIAMGAAMERAHPGESFDAYLARRILQPLGVTVEWRAKCADGKPQLAGGAAMTARDWATFGEFIRRGGVHGNTRLLPDSLVRQLFTPSTSSAIYGMSWWLRGAAFVQNPADGAGERTAPDGARPTLRERLRARRRGPQGEAPSAAQRNAIPQDLVMAAGAGKQRLYVIPSRELVVVRMGNLLGGRDFDDVEFLSTLLQSHTGKTGR